MSMACFMGFVTSYNNVEKLKKRDGLFSLVPKRGLEPPHPKAHGPEPCASTNSAIWAILLMVNFIARKTRSNLIGIISFGS